MKYQHKNIDFQKVNFSKVVTVSSNIQSTLVSGRALGSLIIVGSVLASGCSFLPDNPLYGESGLIHDRSKAYQTIAASPRLDIPEHLNVKQTQDIMDIPQRALSSNKTVDAIGRPEYFYADSGSESVNFKQDGSSKVLVVDAPIQQIWPKAQQFMEFNNLGIANINPGKGTIESDWIVVKGEELGVVTSWVKKLTLQNVKGARKNKLRIQLQKDLKDPMRTVISMKHVSFAASDDVANVDWNSESKNVSYKTDMLYELLRFMSKATNGTVNNGLLASTFKRSLKEGTVLFGRNANGKPALKISGNVDNAWSLVDKSLATNNIDVGTKDRAGRTFYLTFTSLTPKEQQESSFLGWLHGDRGPITFAGFGSDEDETSSKTKVFYSAKGQVDSGKDVGLSDPSHPANQEGFKVWLGGKVVYNFNKGFNKGFFNKNTNLYELTAGYQLKLIYRGKATYVTVLNRKGKEAASIPAEELLWRIKDSIPRA